MEAVISDDQFFANDYHWTAKAVKCSLFIVYDNRLKRSTLQSVPP